MPFEIIDHCCPSESTQIVVVIDDEFTSRTILKETAISISNTIIVESFSSPISALQWLQENEPDLILLDYKMSEMSGISLLRKLKEIDHLIDIPVVVVTIANEPEVRYKMLEAGAADFISKPIDYREVYVRCNNLLALRKHQVDIKKRAISLEVAVTRATHDVLDRERETLLRLAKAGEFRDSETGNHVLRMAKYSRLIAEALGLNQEHCDLIEAAAPMHDIGKIGIPDGILLKQGSLNNDEFHIMKQHTLIGYEILKNSPSKFLALGAEIALGHHEKYDGTGYPNRRKSEEIPIEARIVAVADVFDALTSERPYKKAWTTQSAVDYIVSQSGSHFCPECVNAFLTQLDKILLVQNQLKDLNETESTVLKAAS